MSATTAAVLGSELNPNNASSSTTLNPNLIAFQKKLRVLQNIQLHHNDDGTCHLTGWFGNNSTPLNFPQCETPIVIYFSVQINPLKHKTLTIHTQRPHKNTADTINIGEITIQNARMISFKDYDETVNLKDRIENIRGLIKLGLPIDKFRFNHPCRVDRQALFEVVSRLLLSRETTTGEIEKIALKTVLIADGEEIKRAEELVKSGTFTRNSINIEADLTSPTSSIQVVSTKASALDTTTGGAVVTTAAAAAALPITSPRAGAFIPPLVIDSAEPIFATGAVGAGGSNADMLMVLPNAALPSTTPRPGGATSPAPVLFAAAQSPYPSSIVSASSLPAEGAGLPSPSARAPSSNMWVVEDGPAVQSTGGANSPAAATSTSSAAAKNEDNGCSCRIL